MKNANFIFWRKTWKNVKKKSGCEHKGVNSIFLWFFLWAQFFYNLLRKLFRCKILLYNMMENTTNITSKNIKKNCCEKCDFRCFEKGDFNRHLTARNIIQQIQQKYNRKYFIIVNVEKNMPIALPFSVRLFQLIFFMFQQLLR